MCLTLRGTVLFTVLNRQFSYKFQKNIHTITIHIFFSARNLPALQLTWSNGPKISSSTRITYFGWGLSHSCGASFRDLHFSFSFISADSSIVPDTLIDLSLNLDTCYSRWAPRTHIIIIIIIIITRPLSFESLPSTRKLLSLSLSDCETVIVILNCHSSMNFMNFHTACTQKSDQRSFFLFGAFCYWSSHVESAISIVTNQETVGSKCKWE
jgi:hypothetical protein